MEHSDFRNRQTAKFFENLAENLNALPGKDVAKEPAKEFSSYRTTLYDTEEEAEKAGMVEAIRKGEYPEDIENEEKLNQIIEMIVDRSLDELLEE